MWRTCAVLGQSRRRIRAVYICKVYCCFFLNVFLCFSGIYICHRRKEVRLGFYYNYSKRKDIKSTGEADELNIHHGMGTGCRVGARSQVGVGSGEVGVEVRVGSGEVGVEMVGTGSEQTRGDSDDEYESTVKRVRIDDVRAMAVEPINEWHKSERTIRRWIDDFVSNDGEFSDTQQGHYVRDKTLKNYVREQQCMCVKMLLHEVDPTSQRVHFVSGLIMNYCQIQS